MSGNKLAVLRGILAVLAGLSVPFQVLAADRNSADFWIEKLDRYYTDNAPYRVDYEMDLQMSRETTVVSVAASGDVLFADPQRMRANVRMTMSMDMLPEPMQMQLLMVSDGENVWSQVDNPMAGGQQVVKVSLEAARKLQERSGLGTAMTSDQLDPVAQVRTFHEMLDLAVTGIDNGEVRLEAAATPELEEKLGQAPGFLGEGAGERVVIVLDERSGALRSIALGDPQKPSMTVRFLAMEHVPADRLPADAFSYTPPPGVTVQDLSEAVAAAADDPAPAAVQ